MATKKTATKSASKSTASGAGAASKMAAKTPTKSSGVGAAKTTTKKATQSSGAGAAKKATKKVSSKRELIAPNGDKRLIRRDAQGRIKESDDLGKSLSQDVRKASKTVVKPGQGDRGDQKKTPRKTK